MGNQACGGGARRDPKDPTKPAPRERERGPHGAGRVPASPEPETHQGGVKGATRVHFKGETQPSRRTVQNDAPPRHQHDGSSDTGRQPVSISDWATLQNEASRLLLQDKNTEALAKFKEALNIQVSLLGDRHPDVALTLNNLGIVSRACGNLSEATSYFRHAFELCNEVYGPEDPRTQQARHTYEDHVARSTAAPSAVGNGSARQAYATAPPAGAPRPQAEAQRTQFAHSDASADARYRPAAPPAHDQVLAAALEGYAWHAGQGYAVQGESSQAPPAFNGQGGYSAAPGGAGEYRQAPDDGRAQYYERAPQPQYQQQFGNGGGGGGDGGARYSAEQGGRQWEGGWAQRSGGAAEDDEDATTVAMV